MSESFHLGLMGQKGAGKNLAAEFICQEMPAFYQTALADPLREVCSTIFGLTHNEVSDRELKEKPLDRYPYESPRQILQKVGTECIRSHYPEAWIKAWEQRIKPFPYTVTTDIRFGNEADAMRTLGGKIIRIDRPRPEEARKDTHPSETVLNTLDADKVVVNDGSPELLRFRILSAVRELMEGK